MTSKNKWKMTSIFFDPTRKTTSKKMKDNLKKNKKNGIRPKIKIKNGRRDNKWKTTSKKMEDEPINQNQSNWL